MEYIIAVNPEHFAAALKLMRAYLEFLGEDLSFQNTRAEEQQLDQMYGPPTGAIVLCRQPDGVYAGMGALRRFDKGPVAGMFADTCEMKRLYVLPSYNGLGIGRELSLRLLEKARELGYKAMVLDTLSRLEPALQLYRQLGFYEIEAYYQNPLPGVIYMKKDLH